MGSEPRDDVESAGAVDVSVDRSGPHPRVVISDPDAEQAWISVTEYALCSLSSWQ